MAGEAVTVAAGQAHKDSKENNINTYFSARKAGPGGPAARTVFKDDQGVHRGMTDTAARDQLNQLFASLPGGLPDDVDN